MSRTSSRANESGRIWLDGSGVMHYRSEVYGAWEVQVENLRLIGEYTTDSGPFADDWVVVFACDAEGWYEASAYAEGWQAFCDALTTHLGAKVELHLFGSTRLDSRVVWPEQLAGQELFVFKRRPFPGLRGLLLRLVGVSQLFSKFTPPVLRALQRQTRP